MGNYSNIVYASIFACFMLMLWKDLSATSTPDKQIPVTKVGQLGATSIGPTLKFLYCYSCGYKNLFERYSDIISQKYPEIIIHGGNYEPPGIKLRLAKALNIFKLVFLACLLFGVNIFHKLGANSPTWWNWCLENKMYSGVFVFFLANAIEAHLISTGAFEIILNDMPIWSKLETGRAPEPPELFQIIDNLMIPTTQSTDFPK